MGHDRFLPHPLQFTKNHSSYHSTLSSLSYFQQTKHLK